MQKIIKIEVLGPEPACARCQAVKRTVEKVAEKFHEQDVTVYIEKKNILSKETVEKYGLIFSPALAVNGKLKCMGRVPSEEEVEKLILDEIK
jgi:glutaredoxin